jgi:hypothetical protein
MSRSRVQLDAELLELLADEPELLAIADALVETQTRRRRVRPVVLVGAGALVACVAALAFALAPSGRSTGVSVSAAVAAVGGEMRFVQLHLDSPSSAVLLRYDRVQHRLTVSRGARSVSVSAAQLPSAGAMLTRTFGAGTASAASVLLEYPVRAKSGDLRSIAVPPGQNKVLRWVSYDSALGYVVDLGLAPGSLVPRVIVRRGTATAIQLGSLNFANQPLARG